VRLNSQYPLLISQSVGSDYFTWLYHVVWWVITNVSEQQVASIFIVIVTYLLSMYHVQV